MSTLSDLLNGWKEQAWLTYGGRDPSWRVFTYFMQKCVMHIRPWARYYLFHLHKCKIVCIDAKNEVLWYSFTGSL